MAYDKSSDKNDDKHSDKTMEEKTEVTDSADAETDPDMMKQPKE